METNIFCDKKDMLFINYEAPDGTRKHKRLWNGGNGKDFIKLFEKDKLIDEILCENVGCEYGEYERSDSNWTASFFVLLVFNKFIKAKIF